jgi:hypothetical protein
LDGDSRQARCPQGHASVHVLAGSGVNH